MKYEIETNVEKTEAIMLKTIYHMKLSLPTIKGPKTIKDFIKASVESCVVNYETVISKAVYETDYMVMNIISIGDTTVIADRKFFANKKDAMTLYREYCNKPKESESEDKFCEYIISEFFRIGKASCERDNEPYVQEFYHADKLHKLYENEKNRRESVSSEICECTCGGKCTPAE